MNTRSTSLLLAGALMIATIIPAFATEPAKSPATCAKSTKACGMKKKASIASKKKVNNVAAVKKSK